MSIHKPPSQQALPQEDPLLDIYTWKTGKNPPISLLQGRPVVGPRSVARFEFDIYPEQMACGEEHIMFLTDGKLYTMGENADGKLGISKRNVRNCISPILVHSLTK